MNSFHLLVVVLVVSAIRANKTTNISQDSINVTENVITVNNSLNSTKKAKPPINNETKVTVNNTTNVTQTIEEEAKAFLASYEKRGSIECNKMAQAEWNYNVNVTDANSKLTTEALLQNAVFSKEAWKNATSFNWKEFKDEEMKRQFYLLSVLGVDILNETELQQFNEATSKMQGIYAKTKICSYNKSEQCNLQLDPDITNIMANSRDYDELKHVWKEWHEKAGRPMRKIFTTYVELANKAAELNGLKNYGELWRLPYETDTFESDVDELWNSLKPFYLQLHSYVRRKLRLYYGEDKVSEYGPIPAHLLGNMWAQSWVNIYNITVPYPEKPRLDVTKELKKQGYDVLKMFHTSNEFFQSLGLIPETDSFWNLSVFERLKDREMICHPSAWDFCDKKDFRIKMCTTITFNDFETIHHEMGHTQYYMQYKDQPLVFRDGANPGFHEAVGDTLALSVSTTNHLKEIGLLNETLNDQESHINFLFNMALDKLAFLPFGYTIDVWRWKVFDGNITEKDYNEKWWEIRKELQGIVPPLNRTEEDFDPGAKFHVPANSPYISYFVSYVIQFQFYKALCLESGQYVPGNPTKPLHLCDFYKSKEAGNLLSSMLRMGSSKPWPEAMRVITKGETNKMDASAFIEYFEPLIIFLEKENQKNQEFVGWND